MSSFISRDFLGITGETDTSFKAFIQLKCGLAIVLTYEWYT